MSRIIFNPEKGAEIKNFIFKNEHFLDAKEGQSFMPGMIMKVDDDLAAYMLDTWGFLVEMNVDEAKSFLDSKEDFKCDKCEFKTKVRVALEGHKRKHLNETKIDELGIPVLKLKNELRIDPIKEVDSRQKKWDEEDARAGLIGEGLTNDRV